VNDIAPDDDWRPPDLRPAWHGWLPEIITLAVVGLGIAVWTAVRISRLRAHVETIRDPGFANIATAFGENDAIVQAIAMFLFASVVIPVVGWLRWRKRAGIIG